jgi:hypothetical protein
MRVVETASKIGL